MSSGAYDHKAIEPKWQRYWLENKTFKSEIDPDKPKYYVLDMFPYPSGDGLHVGHPLGYTATDIISRYKRMRGFNVLHPMGWDAFGLPAERHAMRTGEHPAIITQRNCDTFRRQIQSIGLSYDWDREINTTDPDYYKWTQWIFLVLYERGLAYQTEAAVNWCPALGTVLANEEVKDGKYVETGDPVEKRMMTQWMLRITEYAQRLLEDLDELDWPEGIKAMQREWIGRSEGADAIFKVADSGEEFTIFTTRPDTLYGATYCVLAPEHPLVLRVATDEYRQEVKAYAEAAARRSAQERMQEEGKKTGVFTGAYAINPVNQERIPIWVADYVLYEYGYGAIMAVPAHDQRDYEFAKTFNLPIVEVVQGGNIEEEAYEGDGVLINSPVINGLPVDEAKRTISAWLEERGLGKATVTYKLRDWLFSRQRYWGEPFPLITLEDGTVRAVPEKDLPVVLPELDEYKPTAEGEPPLARATDWVNTTDPETGQPAKRETNTMPQWAGSCWYYLRFCDPRNNGEAWSKEAESYWMPVDLYVGGAEHAVLHLLYARFWHKVLYDAGHVSTKEPFQKLFNQGMILAYSFRNKRGQYEYPSNVSDRKVYPVGKQANDMGVFYAKGQHSIYAPIDTEPELDERALVLEWWCPSEAPSVRTYSATWCLSDFVYLCPEEPERSYSAERVRFEPRYSEQRDFGDTEGRRWHRIVPYIEEDGTRVYLEPVQIFRSEIEKMSKSRYNVVNPDTVIEEMGADTLRLYEMFMGPLDREKPWSDEGAQGVHRFIRRVWTLFIGEDGGLSPKIAESGGDASVEKVLHRTIKQVTEDIENLHFNTAISRLMEFVNAAYKAETINREWAEKFVLMFSAFAPHLGEELWERLGRSETLAYEPWPEYDATLLVEDAVQVPVQVNGKLRSVITVPKDAGKDAVLAAAKDDHKVGQYLAEKQLVKEIYVPGKMVNLVVK